MCECTVCVYNYNIKVLYVNNSFIASELYQYLFRVNFGAKIEMAKVKALKNTK